MIFHLPLQRNGYYYMDPRTYKELSEGEDAVKFNNKLKELNATVIKTQNYFLITVPLKITQV